jgi:hypothetical protein
MSKQKKKWGQIKYARQRQLDNHSITGAVETLNDP